MLHIPVCSLTRYDIDSEGRVVGTLYIRDRRAGPMDQISATGTAADTERQPLVDAPHRTELDRSRLQFDAAAGAPSSTAQSSSKCMLHCCCRAGKRTCGLPVRVSMGMLMCSAWIVAYSDRTNISLAMIAMETELGFDAAVDGQVFGAFFLGYFFTQIPGGWSASRWGGKRVLAFAVSMWSLWTVLTPFAARSSVVALVVCRMMLGLGEGLALPALHHVAAQWSPEHERARFVAGVTSGQHIGKAVALGCSPIVAVYWPAIFYIFAAMGTIWLGLWLQCAASSPAEHPSITVQERSLITSASRRTQGTENSAGGKQRPGERSQQTTQRLIVNVPWRRICKEPAFIGAAICHFGHK